MIDRDLLAARAELAQLRRLERYADSDLVRLSLAAWAAMVDIDPMNAQEIEDLPGVISNQGRRTMRSMAHRCLREGRHRTSMAEYWELYDRPETAERFRLAATVVRFKAVVLLAAARETTYQGPPRVSQAQREAWAKEAER